MVDYTASLRFRSDSREVERSEKDLKGLERQSGRTEKAAQRLGRTLGRVFAGLSVGLVARQVIRNTIEQERVTAQLNATLRSTGRFSQETSDALLEQAKAFQTLTAFGDEAVIGAQNVLLTFRRIGSENFPRATEATLDLATAMGTDLRSAAIQVGKALEDPATQMTYLSRAGITFTQQQKDLARELQRTGDLAGAQAVVLKELETQFGGSARAARDTFGGALQALKNAVGDLLEGDTQSGGLKGATDAFNDLTDALNDPAVQQGFDTVISGMGRMLEAAARAPLILGTLGDAVRVSVSGLVDPSDIDQVNLGIEHVVRNIEFLQSAIDTGAAGQFSAVFAASIRRQEAQLAQLQALQAALHEQRRNQGGGVPDSIPGLDIIEKLDAPDTDLFKKGIDEINKILAEMEREGSAAAEALRSAFNDLAGQIGGPTLEATIRYQETLAMLDEQERVLAATGKLTAETEHQLASARALAKQALDEQIEAERERIAALEAQLSPAEQLIADLEFEISLIGLGNREREKEIALRYAGADATDAQRQAIREMIDTLQEESETAANLDQFRSAFSRAFADAARDIRNADDALEALFDRISRIVLQNLGDQLAESLFGAFGSSEVGSSAGNSEFWANMIGALFGGGRATGGPVTPGRFYEVGERGPELLNSGGRQYLIPDKSGQVTPITNQNNYSRRVSTNVTITRPVTRETAVQIANEIGRKQRISMARNR